MCSGGSEHSAVKRLRLNMDTHPQQRYDQIACQQQNKCCDVTAARRKRVHPSVDGLPASVAQHCISSAELAHTARTRTQPPHCYGHATSFDHRWHQSRSSALDADYHRQQQQWGCGQPVYQSSHSWQWHDSLSFNGTQFDSCYSTAHEADVSSGQHSVRRRHRRHRGRF